MCGELRSEITNTFLTLHLHLHHSGGVTWDVCSLFLVTVPPFFALYFGLLYLQSTLQSNTNILAK